MRRTRSSFRSVRRTRSYLPTRKKGKRCCRLTARQPSKRSIRAVKKKSSHAKKGGMFSSTLAVDRKYVDASGGTETPAFMEFVQTRITAINSHDLREGSIYTTAQVCRILNHEQICWKRTSSANYCTRISRHWKTEEKGITIEYKRVNDPDHPGYSTSRQVTLTYEDVIDFPVGILKTIKDPKRDNKEFQNNVKRIEQDDQQRNWFIRTITIFLKCNQEEAPKIIRFLDHHQCVKFRFRNHGVRVLSYSFWGDLTITQTDTPKLSLSTEWIKHKIGSQLDDLKKKSIKEIIVRPSINGDYIDLRKLRDRIKDGELPETGWTLSDLSLNVRHDEDTGFNFELTNNQNDNQNVIDVFISYDDIDWESTLKIMTRVYRLKDPIRDDSYVDIEIGFFGRVPWWPFLILTFDVSDTYRTEDPQRPQQLQVRESPQTLAPALEPPEGAPPKRSSSKSLAPDAFASVLGNAAENLTQQIYRTFR